MTYDDFQRLMGRITESQKRFDERMKRARKLHKFPTRQLEDAAIHLRKAVAEYKKAQKVLDVKMAELAEAQAHTDHRLNALVGRRCGGKSQP